MSITLDEFVESVTSSGLMDAGEVQSFLRTLPHENRPNTAEDFAKELYRAGKLTKFQAQAIYQKKTRGLVVGNYVVLDKLGKGGMGAVYKARHKRMDRVVALKMLPSSATKSADAVQRFQRETRAAAKLSHPNIVTAHDADEAKGVHFLVMEYVEGRDLYAFVKEHGTISVARAVDYVVQAAKGLQYAHSQGVIHRDIKPHNLLLDKAGTIKILDMGLARIGDMAGDADDDDGLTRSGQVMGTLDYMSPEQALDTRTADARADIYSLGCTLHYLLTGRPPYTGDTVTKKILAHRMEPIPSLGELRSDVPQSLDAVFSKMMAKEPKERQQSMTEVIRELQACTLQQGVAAPASFPSSSSGYAETVDLQREDTEPPAEPLSPLDELFASEPIQISERLLGPSLRYKKRWTKQKKILVAAVAGGLVALSLLVWIVAKGTTNGSSGKETKADLAATKETPKSPTAQAVPETAESKRQLAEWVNRKEGQVIDCPGGYDISFHVPGMKITDADIAELRSQCNHLDTLDLQHTAITDEAIRRLSGMSIGRLGLGITSLSDQGLRYLKELDTNRLSYLDLGKTRITDDGLEALKPLTQLSVLYLHANSIGDAGLTHVGQLGKLETLWLFDTKTTDKGLESLLPLTDLKHLRLNENPGITDVGLKHLHSLANLQELNLQGTRVTTAGVAALQVALPNCKVIWDPAGQSTEPATASPKPPATPAGPKPPPAIAPFDATKAKQHQEAWSKHLGVQVEETNSIGMRLVLIPPGEFEMGSTPEEIAWALEEGKKYKMAAGSALDDHVPSEKPRHHLKITKPFYLGMYHVTQGEYEKVIGVNPSTWAGKQMDASAFNPPLTEAVTKVRQERAEAMAGKDTSRHPVETVSWNDCTEFCRRLSALPAERSARRIYRLPTEAEWEYACRAGTTAHWYCGDDEACLDEYAWFGKNATFVSHAVGQKKPNAWGLYDMNGNVWQLCTDWFGDDYYRQSPSNDPAGPPAGSLRVMRGGTLDGCALYCRSAFRGKCDSDDHYVTRGFRVVCEIADKAEANKQPTISAPASYGPNAPPPAIAPFDATKAKQHQEAWAKHLGVPMVETNSIGTKLIFIPPGEFMMGSTSEEIARTIEEGKKNKTEQALFDAVSYESPQHQVEITKPFRLAVCEVTQGECETVVGSNPSEFKVDKRQPVANVSWFDAVAFYNRLSERERIQPYYKVDGETVSVVGGNGYRLPTEAEWEYACRAGTMTKWSLGDGESILTDYARHRGDLGDIPRVGEKKPNPWGLYDMHGNVWEWCWDFGLHKYEAKSVKDPMGRSEGEGRILRGGAYGDLPVVLRSSNRSSNPPGNRFFYVGFRVARTCNGAPPLPQRE